MATGPVVQAVTQSMLAGLLTAARDAAGLPPPDPARPDPDFTVTTARLAERGSGLGGHLGDGGRGVLGDPALRVVRLDATVRIQVLGDAAPVVDDRIQQLHTGLLGRAADLRPTGFLRLESAGTTPLDQLGSRWTKTAGYDVLYEGRHFDPADSAAVITRIAVDGAGGPTVVSGPLVRWADGADEPLVVRGPGQVVSLAALVTRADAGPPSPPPAVPVTVLRTAGGSGPPAVFATLAAFLAAVSGPEPAGCEARVELADLDVLLDALGPARPAEPWPGAPPTGYGGRVLALAPTVRLPAASDRLEFHRAPGPFGAVAYIRVRHEE